MFGNGYVRILIRVTVYQESAPSSLAVLNGLNRKEEYYYRGTESVAKHLVRIPWNFGSNWFHSKSLPVVEDNGRSPRFYTFTTSIVFVRNAPWPFSRPSGYHVAQNFSLDCEPFSWKSLAHFQHMRVTCTQSSFRVLEETYESNLASVTSVGCYFYIPRVFHNFD